MARHVGLHVSGLVQGVWFRESMRQAAERLQVEGWVKNLPDGRVKAELWGEATHVQELIEWCHGGPPDAAVDRVDVVDLKAGDGPGHFEVR